MQSCSRTLALIAALYENKKGTEFSAEDIYIFLKLYTVNTSRTKDSTIRDMTWRRSSTGQPQQPYRRRFSYLAWTISTQGKVLRFDVAAL